MPESSSIPICAVCGRPMDPPGPRVRRKLYCGQACSQKAYRRRQARERELSGPTFSALPPEAQAALGLVAPPVPAGDPLAGLLDGGTPEDQVAAALLAARSLSAQLHRLGRDAHPRLSWRCQDVARKLDAALHAAFGEVGL